MSFELNEELFPGNAAALSELKATLEHGAMIGFTGAGVSAPLFPTWVGLLSQLLVEARDGGLLVDPKELSEYQSLIDRDPLELAGFLEETFTKHSFRTKLASTFRNPNENITQCHEILSSLGLRGIVTLNYDDCHEVASAKRGLRASSGRSQDHATLTQWLQNKIFENATAPILHLHGDISDPSHMIITKDDYHAFYSDPIHQTFIQNLWRATRLLVVGFGFSDPFLTRVAEQVLRSIDSDSLHFALIGRRSKEAVSPLQRRLFMKQYRLKPIFYEVRESTASTGRIDQDHSQLAELLASLPKPKPKVSIIVKNEMPTAVVATPTLTPATIPPSDARKEFEKDLFILPSKAPLYVEPRLVIQTAPHKAWETEERFFSVNDIVNSPDSFVIAARPEYGATTLARRLNLELTSIGKTVCIKDASALPNYKKKLEQTFANENLSVNSGATLILDGVELARDERLIKEVIGTSIFKRIILLVKMHLFEPAKTLPIDQFSIPFKVIFLSNMHRSDIRVFASQFFETSDPDVVSGTVDQVYRDLIALCIPITPANVIMYLTILYKEGDFHPINRVQIVSRYLIEMLRRPSDAFTDSFNARDKLNVVSAFVYKLFEDQKSTFNDADWYVFCRQYMKDRLTHFDERSLLNDLLGTKIFVRVGFDIALKYRFFYIYFLGRHISSRPEILSASISAELYLKFDGLSEVIAELASDSTPLFKDVIEKLTKALNDFGERYVPETFDPFSELEWPTDPNEDEKLWKPLSKKLASGPRNPSEIDQIKRSLSGEQRATDQTVVVRAYDELEQRLIGLHHALIEALRNADNLEGQIKKSAVLCALKTSLRFFQVCMMFAPIIAEKAYYVWYGLVFIIENKSDLDDVEEKERKILAVVSAFRRCIVDRTAEEIGSRKLGEVFKLLTNDPDVSGYLALSNFTCLVRAKPNGWFGAAQDAIANTDRKAFYLRSMLHVALKQFSEEVNTGSERELLKKLIATIQIKRMQKKDHPGEKHVAQVVQRLESQDYFDKAIARIDRPLENKPS